MDNLTDKKGPAVRFPPPLIFVALWVVGYLLQQVVPVRLGLVQWGHIIGLSLILISLASLLGLLVAYWRNKTAIEPWKPTTYIITTGFYAWSRNPIYASLCLLTIGVG